MKFNHNKKLHYFQSSIDIIKNNEFEPIAVTQLNFYDAYVFNTDIEAQMAYELLEVGLEKVFAWWYSKEKFIDIVEEYEKQNGCIVKVFWL